MNSTRASSKRPISTRICPVCAVPPVSLPKLPKPPVLSTLVAGSRFSLTFALLLASVALGATLAAAASLHHAAVGVSSESPTLLAGFGTSLIAGASASVAAMAMCSRHRRSRPPAHARRRCTSPHTPAPHRRSLRARHDPNSPALSPAEFESWCAQQLRLAGWSAVVTGGSGDQGVDVRATRGERTLVIQCKRLRTHASNAAVQSVFAGRAFVGASEAVVVATAGFTPSARRLASRIGVRLLAPHQLRSWADTPSP